jgi:hypothetical protein
LRRRRRLIVAIEAVPIAATISCNGGHNPLLSRDSWFNGGVKAMPIRALGLLSKVSSKFVHEVLPVAMASVIGTILVNHYSRQPSPAVVVQASPPPSEDAVLQSLHEEHALIADYLKRKQEAEAKRVADAEAERAPAEAATPPVVESRPIKLRLSSAEKAASRPASTPAHEKKLAVQDPPPLAPDALTVPPPAQPQPSEADGPAAQTLRFAGVVRERFVDAAWFPARLPVVRRFGGFVVDVAQFPARALVWRPFDDPPTPPALMHGQDLSGQE